MLPKHCFGSCLSYYLTMFFFRRLGAPGRERSGGKAGWDRECARSSHQIFAPVLLDRWMVICPRNMEREMRGLIAIIKKFSGAMDFDIKEPRW